jgi:hypothetical protein
VAGSARAVVVDVTPGQDDAAVMSAEPSEAVVQARLPQRLGGLRRAGDRARPRRTQAEVARCGDEGDHAAILPDVADTGGPGSVSRTKKKALSQ